MRGIGERDIGEDGNGERKMREKHFNASDHSAIIW